VKCKVASHGLFCFKGFLVEGLSEIDLTIIAELKKKKSIIQDLYLSQYSFQTIARPQPGLFASKLDRIRVDFSVGPHKIHKSFPQILCFLHFFFHDSILYSML